MRTALIILYFFVVVIADDHRFSAKFHTFTNDSLLQMKAEEGHTITFSGLLTYANVNDSMKNEELTLKCWMDYEKVGAILNWTDYALQNPNQYNSSFTFAVDILAKRLGGSYLFCSLNIHHNAVKLYESRIMHLVVSRTYTVVELIFRIIVSLFVIFLTFVMGCGLDRDVIMGYSRNPIAPFIGFFSQFVFMPLIFAMVGRFSRIESAFGFGLLAIGCSPGGGASTIWTALLGGDVNLSMAMTFVSSIAAIVMMPLWLFLLSRLFMDPQVIQIPYGSIGLNLLQIVIPTGLGILFRWKWKKKAKILSKRVKMMGLVFIIFILTFGTYVNFYIYRLIGDYIYLLPIGALLPWTGFLFGFVLAILTQRTKSEAIAISLETGFQNIAIPLLILKYSIPQPDGDLGSMMPIIVALFTPLPLYFGYFILFVQKCFSKARESRVMVKMNPLFEDNGKGVEEKVV